MYHSLTGAEQNSKLKSLGEWKTIERDEKLKPFFGHKGKKNLRDYGNDYLTDGSELFMCTWSLVDISIKWEHFVEHPAPEYFT